MRLLEREREYAAAQALIDGAATGGGGLLVVEGPSGIGKSALLAELARRAAAAGVAARSVRATRLGAEVPGKFDVIVSRAFAELADFVTLARHLVADDGAIWAMKGIRPDGEIERLPEGAHVKQVIRLKVPALDAERHLIEVTVG